MQGHQPSEPASPTQASGPELPPRDDILASQDASALLAAPGARRLGRGATRPGEMPWPGWKAVLRRTFADLISDRISLVAAGCAFYATLALFPTISMLVSIYGLVFDPAAVEGQLEAMHNLLPPAAFTLIAERVHALVNRPSATLGFSLAISTAVTLWSAGTGTKSILSALNIAYEERERRSFLRFQLIGFCFTLGGICAAVLGLGLLLGLPAVMNAVGLEAHQQALLALASYALLLIFVLLALAVLYRFGPSRRPARWRWISPGSIGATLIWLVASFLFSWYVTHVASYNATYGPLAAVVGIMMWFWVTAYAVLFGAELNSELELQTVCDSTEGPDQPMGDRGAFVADHIAE